jgi:tetratricopeptide (TPR) repeat protein
VIIMAATRRVNVRFLGVLVGALAILGPSVYFVNAYQVRRNADALKHRADQAYEEGRYLDAAKYYHLYLIQHPDDVKARIGCGQALDKKSPQTRADQVAAFENFDSVLRLEPDHDDIRRRQVDLALAIGERDVAMGHIKKLLDGSRKNDGELEQLLALCHAVRNEDAEAVKDYLLAIEHAPRHLPSYVQLANVYLTRTKERSKANDLKDQMLRENGDKWEAHLAAAAILRYQGLPEDEEVKKALELAPDKAETILEAAATAYRQHKLEEARALLERGLKLHPKNQKTDEQGKAVRLFAEMYYRLARVEMEAGRIEQTEECLRRGLREVPEPAQIPLIHLLATVLIQRGQIEEAEKHIESLRSRGASDIYVKDLRARVHMQKEEWFPASRVLEELRLLVGQQPEFAFQIEMLLGRCYERLREPDRALESYEQALRLRPDSPDELRARRGKASALLTQGRLDEALVEFRRILPKDPTAALPLARLLTDRNLRLEEKKRDWKAVEELLRSVPSSPELAIFKAQLAQIQSRSKEGLEQLQKERDKDPSQPGPWLAIIQTSETEGNPTKTLALIEDAEKKLGDRVELRLARARQWLRSGGDAAPPALAKLEQDTGKFNQADQSRLLTELGNLYILVGNIKEAKRLWTQLAKIQPKNLPVRTVLFELAFLSGATPEEVDPLLREIRAIEGDDGTLWRYCQACRIILAQRLASRSGKVDRNQLTEARGLLANVIAQRPKWGRVALREAELAELEGNAQGAIDSYQRALSLGERDPLAFRPVIYLLYQRGKYTDAETILATLQEQTPNLPDDLRQLRISILGQLGKAEAAVDLAAKPIQAGSKNPADYYWYAQALAQLPGKQDEAERAYRAALVLPGIDRLPKIWVQFVRFLAQANQKAKAEEVVRGIANRVPAEQAPFILAECYDVLNQPGRVEEQYLNVLKKSPANPDALWLLAEFYDHHDQLPRAEPYLRRLLEPQTAAAPAAQAMARRLLAITLASTGNYEKFEEALRLLEQNAPDGKPSVADQHARAKIYAKHAYYWRRAMDLYERLQSEPGGLSLDEQLELARLYENQNEWVKARPLYLGVLAANANNPAIIYLCARNLLRHHEADGIPNWLDRLEKMEGPQSLRVMEIRIRLLNLQGKLDEAAKDLKVYAERPDAKEENLKTAAALLEEFGKPSDAEDLYRKLVDKTRRPENTLLLAACLSRLGRAADIEEALEICEKAWQTCPPENVAFVAVAVLSAAKNRSPQQYQRVERGLAEALRKSPKSLALIFYMAGLRSLEQQYGEAEKSYRQILERDPGNALALNNLAWLLAARDGKSKAAEALDLINQAIKAVGPSAELLDTRAFIYLKMDNAEEAVKDLKDAVKEQNPSAVMYFHLAQAQQMLKDPEAADSFRRAKAKDFNLKVHPLEQQAYDQLSKMLGT